ncbi:MAG: indolepyruvate ferredoxin oxidoreductase subunit alpha [Thermoplasmataceae archaeon]|jgi:indolepyruvate ferredoxin oxidoreductase alpha subunit
MVKLNDLMLDSSEETILFLLSNEAIARGAVEAGVKIATTYPGTPSSEVGDTLSLISKKFGMKFQFSVNEKVAIETAFAASISGLRSMVFMKHVGLNVASDPFMSTAYTGVRAGMVVMTADDPSMYSSQNEQDNRHYADLAHVPMIEPSNPQEAKDFLLQAFDLSEKFQLPVLFRTTTRVSHMRGLVKLGEVKKDLADTGVFVKDVHKFVCLPSNSYTLKEKLIEKIHRLKEEADRSQMNRIEHNGNGKYGIITSGAAYNSVMDVVTEYALDSDILKLGFTNPIPEKIIGDFITNHRNIIIVEELDPYLEYKIRTLAQMHGLDSRIYGKLDGFFSESHEFTPDTVANSLSKIIGFTVQDIPKGKLDLPPRPPVLCPGCPHRAAYYAVKRAVKMMNKPDTIFASDIGCYSLGVYDPYEEADTMISMGSSIGMANGFAMSTKQKVVAFIGDSTFFHSGIPPLINAVHNKLNILVMVLDNGTTAMTGQQPNPGEKFNSLGEELPSIAIEDIVRSLGVKNVQVVDPYDLKESLKAITSALKEDSVSVIISRRECAILRDKEMQKSGKILTYTVDQDKCGKCMNCVENFSCPALFIENREIKIDANLCDGCGVCAEPYVCPFQAIEVRQ